MLGLPTVLPRRPRGEKKSGSHSQRGSGYPADVPGAAMQDLDRAWLLEDGVAATADPAGDGGRCALLDPCRRTQPAPFVATNMDAMTATRVTTSRP